MRQKKPDKKYQEAGWKPALRNASVGGLRRVQKESAVR